MKKFITIILILSISLILITCTTKENKEEPKISLKFSVSDLTEEEFQSVGAKKLENPIKDDFKNVEFKLDVENSNKISNRKITVPSIREIIKSQYSDRYWFGEVYSQDNEEENFAEYSEKIVFYSNGLKEEEFKDIFKSSDVKISWITDKDKYREKIFNLGDIIEFI